MPGGVPQDQIVDQTPQVEPSATLTENVPMGSAVGSAAQEAGAIFQKEQYWANHAAAIDAMNRFQALDNEKLYHPETGLFNQDLGSPEATGKASEATLNDYREHMSQISAGLKNDAQRAMFQRQADEHLNTVTRQVYGYENKQYTKWDTANTTASIQNAQVAAVNTYELPDDPGQGSALQHQVDKQVSLIKDFGKRNGLPQSEIDRQLFQAKSATYAAVADDAISKNNTTYASELLERHGGEMAPEARDRLRRALTTTDTNNQAQQIANGFLRPDDSGMPVTRADFLQRLETDKDLAKNADLYDKVAARGERYFAMKEQATRAEQMQIGEEVSKALLADPTQDPMKVAGPSKWERLSAEQQASMLRMHDQAIRKELPEANSPRSIEVRNIVGTPEFLEWDANTDRDKIAPAELREYINMQAEQRQKERTPSTKITAVVSENDILNGYLRQLGLDPRENANTTADQAKQIYSFKYNFAIQKQAAIDANGGKPLDSKQLDAIAAKLVAHTFHERPAGFFERGTTVQDDEGPLFMQGPERVQAEFDNGRPAQALTSRVTPEEMTSWKRVLADPKDPGYGASIEKLKRWKMGIDEQGNPNPALKERYRTIRSAMETQTMAPPPVTPAPNGDF